MAELSMPCFSYSLLNRPRGAYSLPSRVSGGTTVPCLRTKPALRGPALPARFAAGCLEGAWLCGHTSRSAYFRESSCVPGGRFLPPSSGRQRAGRRWAVLQKAVYSSLRLMPGEPKAQLLLP